MQVKKESAYNLCAICSALADGIHYGAISCRSCNAFFRRTVVEKVQYYCKNDEKCVIDPDGRCACRFCRYKKCLSAGMKVAAVQPRRDPTGSQKERRKRTCENLFSSIISNVKYSDVSEKAASVPSLRFILGNEADCSSIHRIKSEETESEECKPSTSHDTSDGYRPSSFVPYVHRICDSPTESEYFQFCMLVESYNQHLRMIQLSFATIPSFLDELEKGPPVMREITPEDSAKLSKAELMGLFFWLEKVHPYKSLPADERENLLKRYSIRKLNLDHFYIASQHTSEVEKRNLVLNNYVYVPPTQTGFECPGDDERQIKIKRETFAETTSCFWKNVILRFVELSIHDAEAVYLQLLLLWSVSNNEFVSFSTKNVMREQREWAMRCLFEFYGRKHLIEPEIRFAEITLLLGEIEQVCDMHCRDVQLIKVFELCEMGNTWYEDMCYSQINNPRMEWDINIAENLKQLTVNSILEGVRTWRQENCDISGPSNAKDASPISKNYEPHIEYMTPQNANLDYNL